MKNFPKFIAVSAIFISLISCDKEKIDQTESQQQVESTDTHIDAQKYPGISIEDGVLSFESIEYYESLVSDESENQNVDELVSYINATSFNSYGKTYGEASTYDEPFMDAIMNEEQIVKIGEWYIYIDIPSEVVLTLSETEENAYASLLNRSNRNIREFNIGDDVLVHLRDNSSPQDRACGGIGGGTYTSSTKNYNGINFWSYVKFFRAGVYFRLTGGYESDAAAYTYFYKSLEIKNPQAWCKRKNCGSGTTTTWPAGSFSTGYDNSYVFELYENVRNLNGYYLYVRAHWPGVSTDWVGRNINSPY